MGIFQFWNANYFRNPVSISRQELMKISKICAKATYHKCIKDLHAYGYIQFLPSFKPLKGSLVYPFKGSLVYLFDLQSSAKPLLASNRTNIETNIEQMFNLVAFCADSSDHRPNGRQTFLSDNSRKLWIQTTCCLRYLNWGWDRDCWLPAGIINKRNPFLFLFISVIPIAREVVTLDKNRIILKPQKFLFAKDYEICSGMQIKTKENNRLFAISTGKRHN